MKFSPKRLAKKFVASETCTVWEYALGSDQTNGAVAEITGRYPERGWAVNEQCSELVYVVGGRGSIVMPDKTTALEPGDVALIEAGEQFAWQGERLVVFVPCFPAWTHEQHKLIDA